ncbi:MAG: superoxide dismutase [Ni] [Verrucomicrobiota bacterium]
MRTIQIVLALLTLFSVSKTLDAHCQVPCGIYGDELKFGELEQHVETIAKASKELLTYASKDSLSAQDLQQVVRWTTNKESHAAKIIDETANYFLAQRIKPGADHYGEKIELLHHIIVFSMKAKQQADPAAATALGEKVAAFKALYLDHDHAH